MIGKIHSYESMATLDGEGIRYGVFLSGCNFRCSYCHNPDTYFSGEYSEIEADDLLRKILRYKTYFGENGGVTFSGGEPLLQSDFLVEMGDLLKKNGIKYAIDTSGGVELSKSVKKAVDGAELVILDLKFYDNESYMKNTCGGIDRVLKLANYLNEINKKTWLRTVIVPNINDDIDSINKYYELSKSWTNVEKYELLGFHTMGFFKYEQLGLENKLIDTKSIDITKLESLQLHLDNQRK